MSLVIPLQECIARPPTDRSFGLLEHLLAVARGCGSPTGSPDHKLAFLAGLAHDAAKAARDWQEYIRSAASPPPRSPSTDRKPSTPHQGPPHAPLGAALFAFWAHQLLPIWAPDRSQRECLFDLLVDWTRLIYNHHGQLDDLDPDGPPWHRSFSVRSLADRLSTCDAQALDALVRQHFPEYSGSLDRFPQWLDSFANCWRRHCRVVRPDLLRNSDPSSSALRLPDLGARLVYADRSHAALWRPSHFSPRRARRAIARFQRYCSYLARRDSDRRAHPHLVEKRAHLQSAALDAYRRSPDDLFYALLLPTGYGKTLAGLRVALEAIHSGRCKRLIYVAPYISILSQAAAVLHQATSLPVVTHHHLSILASTASPATDWQAEDHQPYDLLDSWQTPILATTFNQLFRALFPQRAQDCLRIPALDRAFLFIDEPQILQPSVWAPFLRALHCLARQRLCQVLFTTATLPPLDPLGIQVRHLTDPVSPICPRYRISFLDHQLTADHVARQTLDLFRRTGSVAVILNTIRDALDVFRRLLTLAPASHRSFFFLSSLMLPAHKHRVLARLRKRLRLALPTAVVCTQILEAGVDLSFRSLLRALPVFPSLVQAAGRANRHAHDPDPAHVLTFPFLRADDPDSPTDTRPFVYRDPVARNVTDHLLQTSHHLLETNIPQLLDSFFRQCWQQNDHTASFQCFQHAASGAWSALANLQPFGDDIPKASVFLPFAHRFFDPSLLAHLSSFQATSAAHVLSLYLDRSTHMPFHRRKHLSALIQQCTVPVPLRLADTIARPVQDIPWLYTLRRPFRYDKKTGLAHALAPHLDDSDTSLTLL